MSDSTSGTSSLRKSSEGLPFSRSSLAPIRRWTWILMTQGLRLVILVSLAGNGPQCPLYWKE